MERNPEKHINQIESLTPMQQMIKEMEVERAARTSERWNPKDIAIGVTGGILWLITCVELAEVIKNISN